MLLSDRLVDNLGFLPVGRLFPEQPFDHFTHVVVRLEGPRRALPAAFFRTFFHATSVNSDAGLYIHCLTVAITIIK